MKLTGEQAREFLSVGWVEGLNLAVESDEQIGTSRWESIHQLVLRDGEGRFWAATYTRGLTEHQDVQPFEYMEEVEFREMEKIPVTTYEYRERKTGT